MRSAIIFLLTILISLPSVYGGKNTQRIAIIDTGLDIFDPRFHKSLCDYKDFTDEGIADTNSHGTHVAGLIQKYAKEDHCLMIYKYFSTKTEALNQERFTLAIKEAINKKADIINISGGGGTPNREEFLLIKNNPQILFVVAAGNNGSDLEVKPFYPASYGLKNILVVGNITSRGTISITSNYGKLVKFWEVGERVKSTIPCKENICDGYASGTSMSTAIKTGKLINEKTSY